MDPLSDLLARLRPQSSVSAGFDAAGAWGVSFSNPEERIKCYALVSGQCWMRVVGQAPRLLSAGDAFVLPGGRDFALASHPDQPCQPAETLFPPQRAGGTVRINGGGEVFLVGSRFVVGGAQSLLMLGMLPPVIHLRPETGADTLRDLVQAMMREVQAGQAGADLMASHLAHMMLIQALRAHLAQPRALSARPGWFGALAEPRLARALRALHGAPERRWTVQDLARASGMSRSSFALAFRSHAGETPMDYLTRWRMFLALDLLETGRQTLAQIAEALGYGSESSFSTAFKRVMGQPPRAFARGQTLTVA